MPTVPPVVVKLGGSVLTRKARDSSLRQKVLAKLAQDLARVPAEQPLIILHGAGSFGHPGAERWKLAEPPLDDPRSLAHRLRGAAVVQFEVRRLHGAVLRALLDAGISSWSIPPAAVARNRDGLLFHLETHVFEEALERGARPVAFGDVVPDEQWQFSILSADTLAVELVRRLGAARAIFVSDVPGILVKSAAGQRRVADRATEALLQELSPISGHPDVTGGIRGKLRAMLAIRELGADAGLISGLSDGALSRAIRGEIVYGTWAQSTAR